MKTIVQVLTVLILLPWPILVMTAPMMFGAPGASNDRGNLLMVLAVLVYPVLVFAIYRLMGWTFFSVSATKILIGFLIICSGAVFISGIPKMLYNLSRGISNEGYFKTADSVYWSGDKISSDPQHFEELDGAYSRDSKAVYHFGKKVEGADPKTFKVQNDSKAD